MTNYHTAFNMIITQIMTQLKLKLEAERMMGSKIESVINLVIDAPKINMFTPLNIFMRDVYPSYRTQIFNGDDDFFMKENYDAIDNDIVSLLKSLYSRCSSVELDELKKSMKKLIVIGDKAIESGVIQS